MKLTILKKGNHRNILMKNYNRYVNEFIFVMGI